MTNEKKTAEEIRAMAEAEVKAIDERKAKERSEHFGFIRPMGSRKNTQVDAQTMDLAVDD